MFQHTAARRRLQALGDPTAPEAMFQHTAARRRLPDLTKNFEDASLVSTHSRAEAAATEGARCENSQPGFNTQPRGGGCSTQSATRPCVECFNTQPRGGGCTAGELLKVYEAMFQHTAARRRLRLVAQYQNKFNDVSTHSRAEAAADLIGQCELAEDMVSTHSRAEAAAFTPCKRASKKTMFQHTAARRRLQLKITRLSKKMMFQHTAARRRLLGRTASEKPLCDVSTHSRAEAAANVVNPP